MMPTRARSERQYRRRQPEDHYNLHRGLQASPVPGEGPARGGEGLFDTQPPLQMNFWHIVIILQQVQNATVRHRPRRQERCDADAATPPKASTAIAKTDASAVQTANH